MTEIDDHLVTPPSRRPYRRRPGGVALPARTPALRIDHTSRLPPFAPHPSLRAGFLSPLSACASQYNAALHGCRHHHRRGGPRCVRTKLARPVATHARRHAVPVADVDSPVV